MTGGPSRRACAPAARAAGLLAGAAVVVTALLMGLGDVLVALGQPQLAAHLPGNTRAVAAALLPPRAGRPASPETRALARAALRNAPLTSEALTFLALDARRSGDDAAARRLLSLAAATGWHDETAQRQLYNAALRAGDAPAAARHADALLRQSRARDELFAQFDRGLATPRYRQALLPYLAASPGWPRDYLTQHGAALADAPLAQVLAARATAQDGLERAIAGPLIARLIAAGRPGMAAQAWRLVRGASGIAPGVLPWQPALPTLFDWQIPPAYRPDGSDGSGSDTLTAPAIPGTPPLLRYLALPPGTYRITPDGPVAPAQGWAWSLSCSGRMTWPAQPLGGGAVAVAADCPVQVLAIAAAPLAGPLGPVAVVPVAVAPVPPQR